MNIDIYKTKNGSNFRFRFEPKVIDSVTNYVIYILDQPSYGARADDLYTTRRGCEGENHFIRYPGPVPTLEDAKIVAALWADFTERYMLTGQALPGE